MHNILIVDDSTETVHALSKAINAHRNIFKAFNVADGKAAMDMMGVQKIDLVITELNLPIVNGIALIKYLIKSHPIPILVLTAYGNPEIASKINLIPNVKYFSKPPKIDILLDTIFRELKISHGQVNGVGLSSFLQLLEMEAKTCTLSVASGHQDKIGTLFFMEGELIGAETDDKIDEVAAYEILSWEDAKINIVYNISQKERKINQSLMNILMEAAKLKDEKEVKNLFNKSEEPADNDTIQTFLAEIGELELGDEQAQFPDSEETPVQMTAEEVMQAGPIADILRRMKDALAKVIGPIAQIVFSDALNVWLEGLEPSKDSIPSLLDILDQEIGDPEKISKFRFLVDAIIERI